jgi:hypothetical protein
MEIDMNSSRAPTQTQGVRFVAHVGREFKADPALSVIQQAFQKMRFTCRSICSNI